MRTIDLRTTKDKPRNVCLGNVYSACSYERTLWQSVLCPIRYTNNIHRYTYYNLKIQQYCSSKYQHEWINKGTVHEQISKMSTHPINDINNMKLDYIKKKDQNITF